jgi:hypothetical protein
MYVEYLCLSQRSPPDSPAAVNTTALIQLAMVMDSPFFRVLATVVMFVLLLLWFVPRCPSPAGQPC